ncbi:ATP-binding protein [Spirochaeta isovalerica]|uniref:ATP-binding protein n=1 Tax=Spirochaeta isovalerica TaxID=150 RepID=UPI00248375D2|nr:ATP-binding protein [Spirochaeta isovalerica]
MNRIPFFTTKKEGKGTGLGLSLSYFIITDTHKGKMYVSSELNKGTTFTILLPLEQ